MADKKPLNKQIPSSMTYPNPYAEGEFFSPSNIQLNVENIRKNIPLDLSNPQFNQPSAIPPQPMPQTNVIRNAGLQMIPQEPKPEDDTNYLGSLIAQGVTGLGIGLMGGSPLDIQHSANTFQSMRDKQTNEKKAKLYTDPNSEESKKRRLVYSKALGIDIPSEFSYTDLNDPTVLQSIRDKSAQARLANMPKQGGVSGAGKPKEEKPKERKLSQDERALLNNSALAYKALFDMEDAIKKNVSKTSYLGDNPYTYAANRFVEGIGRMQSGGAIGPDEVENFKKLIPGRFDSDELSKQKIKDMKTELEARLKSINYDPKEILQSRTYLDDEISPSEQDQAIKWANENINSINESDRIKAKKILEGK